MKITIACYRCRKTFDYEKHNGICPKCAAYNRPPGKNGYDFDVQKEYQAKYTVVDNSHERLHKMYDSAPAHQPGRQHEQYHKQYDNGAAHPAHAQTATPARQYPAGQYPAGQYQGQGNAQNRPYPQSGPYPQNRMYQQNRPNPQNRTHPQGVGGAGGRTANKSSMHPGVKIVIGIFIFNFICTMIAVLGGFLM